MSEVRWTDRFEGFAGRKQSGGFVSSEMGTVIPVVD